MSAVDCFGNSDHTRLEIVSYGAIVFEGTFPSLAAARDFHAWWTNQKTLPQGGATLGRRADLPDAWRERHPLRKRVLTSSQLQLIHERLSYVEPTPVK